MLQVFSLLLRNVLLHVSLFFKFISALIIFVSGINLSLILFIFVHIHSLYIENRNSFSGGNKFEIKQKIIC